MTLHIHSQLATKLHERIGFVTSDFEHIFPALLKFFDELIVETQKIIDYWEEELWEEEIDVSQEKQEEEEEEEVDIDLEKCKELEYIQEKFHHLAEKHNMASWKKDAPIDINKILRIERSVFKISVYNNIIEVNHLEGPAPYTSDIIAYLARFRWKFHRKHPFNISIRTGMSGCKDWFINFPQEIYGKWRIRRKHLLHSSCYGKLNRDMKMYESDLFLICSNVKKEESEQIAPKTVKCFDSYEEAVKQL